VRPFPANRSKVPPTEHRASCVSLRAAGSSRLDCGKLEKMPLSGAAHNGWPPLEPNSSSVTPYSERGFWARASTQPVHRRSARDTAPTFPAVQSRHEMAECDGIPDLIAKEYSLSGG
jgi:hypothetical protein